MFQLLAPLGRGQIERDARGSSGTMPKISQGHIKSWRIVVPPIDEQRILVASIVAHTNSDNTAIIQTQREISFLLEYRTRLFADVVTGKLDVREAAATLPDEAEDLGVLDTVAELEGTEDMAGDVASDDETEEEAA
jgi:type I restriction enzyme S subunit